jgi:iron complex outermembrane receptor protein
MNSFDALGREFTIGIDSSKRNWDGKYYSDLQPFIRKSIDDVDTVNNALFMQCTNQLTDTLKVELGLRYDNTDISHGGALQDNDYNSLGGNIVATYAPNDNTKYFVGVGQASRVPDARELYFVASNGDDVGTPNLKETTNTEIDLGTEHAYDNGKVKGKIFYSDLKDYIYFNKDTADTTNTNVFENINATIYGFELSGAYYLNDQFTLDAGYTWKKGEKDTQPTGATQTDKDLADITPPKLTVGLTYDHDANTFASIEFVHVDKWKDYDADNGEQEINSYNIVNIKGQTTIAKNFELTVGVDNLFDKTYAVSNTYEDLTLLSDGTDVMLLNEPGRYAYASLKYKF